MNILLPKNGFKIFDKDGVLIAETKDDMLYIYRPQEYKTIQYKLTEEIYGTTCMYCKKNPAVTMDHRIPRAYGGPTFTNNLYPCCQSCNSLKADLFEDEFEHLLSLEDKKERREYLKSLKPIQHDRKVGLIPVFPKEWLSGERRFSLVSPLYVEEPSGVKYASIYANIYLEEPLGDKFVRHSRHFSTYKKNKDPYVYSCNYFLLDGFTEFLISKKENRKVEDHIVLENVKVVLYQFCP